MIFRDSGCAVVRRYVGIFDCRRSSSGGGGRRGRRAAPHRVGRAAVRGAAEQGRVDGGDGSEQSMPFAGWFRSRLERLLPDGSDIDVIATYCTIHLLSSVMGSLQRPWHVGF